MKKIILLSQQWGCPIILSPARYQLIHELKKQNYEIYVFYQEGRLTKNIKSDVDYSINTLELSIKDIRKKIIDIDPQYIIAFTYEDIRILYPLAWIMKKTSFIYYNLEIYTPSMEKLVQPEGSFFQTRCKLMYFQNKVKEIIYTKKCSLFVIQDLLRKKTSAKYFIHHPNTMLIPNSYIFDEENKMESERCGIVYSGGLNKVQLGALLRDENAVSNIPITFSGWSDKWFRGQYRKIHKTHPNIILHEQKLPIDEFTKYLRQYAIGLIWYCPSGDDNMDMIGMASGKLFKHLSLGQPVIVNDCPGIGKVVNKYKLGIVIKDVSELQEAYERIMANYTHYQSNVIEVYKNRFDYKKVIRPFLSQLERLGKN